MNNKIRALSFSIVFLFAFNTCFAQQYMLYNSRTLYDSFENVSQKAFQADTTYRYAFNFFIPTVSVNGLINGPANDYFRKVIFQNSVDVNNVSPVEQNANIIGLNANIYLVMFRAFTNVNSYKEAGFSWQIRNDTRAELANAIIVLSDNANPFTQGTHLIGALNGNSYTQSYHQFSFTYRRNSSYDKRLGYGVKLSYLSGINYNAIELKNAQLNEVGNTLTLQTSGTIRSNHSYDPPTKEEVKSWLYPGFKNPGFSFSLSANYKLQKGWFVLANLKDVGFLYWNNAYEYKHYPFNLQLYPSNNVFLGDLVVSQLDDNLKRKSFISPTNGKVEVLVNKDLEFYQPNLIASKNLFYSGWDVALVNNFSINKIVLSASASYNSDSHFQLGGQFMVKSPNFDFYLGSNQLLGTYTNAKMFLKSDNTEIGSGGIGASMYFGLSFKFGPVVYHRPNSPYVPL